MKCNTCTYLDFDFFSTSYEKVTDHFCGLHGRAKVDPFSKQQLNLDSHGSCGYCKKRSLVPIQLSLF